MATIDDVKTAAQALLDAVNALEAPAPAPVVAPEDAEVDIILTDGSKKTFVPKA